LPHARLEAGRWLQSIGDCAAGRREFADLLAADPPPTEAAEARYRLAQCYLRDDAAPEAAAVLTQLLATAADVDPYHAPATFFLGEALTALGRWHDAEVSYTAYLPLVPELASLTWQRIGAARHAQGDLPAAVEAYTNALKDSPDWENTVAIRRALADLALAQKDYRSAAIQYDLLRGKLTKGAWAAEMQWLAGSALAQATEGQAEAWQRWQAAADADPTGRYAHQAIVALLDAGAPVDEYQRGLVDYHNGLYQLALQAFARAAAAEPQVHADAIEYYSGLSYLKLAQTDRGLVALDKLIANYPDSPLWADAWMAKAGAQARAERASAAIVTYRRLAELRPNAVQAPKALWQAATLQLQGGALGPAAAAYLELARRYPVADEGWRAYLAAGLCYFRLEEWQRAGEVWDEMARAKLPAWTRPVAYYWLGRAQAAAGETEAGRGSWQLAVEADPNSFYGLRAADWIEVPESGRGGEGASGWMEASVPGSREAEEDQPARAGAEVMGELAAWLRGWAGEGTLALPTAVTNDPDWRRGEALLTLGLRRKGLAAWERVQKRHASEPWTLTALALAFRAAGAHRLSILSAEQVAAQWPAGTLRTAPVTLQQLAYPLPYAAMIREQAEKWGLDPRLLAAMIRQESHFESAAISPAGAQGLMQVMPGTAQGIAARLGWRDFSPEQAYWPYVNVAFGAYYVSSGLKQFDGSLVAALAAYNAGPGNAAIWRKLAPKDDDLMVALIDFAETRIYVQTVWVQYEVYRELYPEW
jgi:soluble lytic murein transglycosylase